MKLFRRLSALTMVLALLLSLSISVFAADYDAANMDDMYTAFADGSGEDVNINLTADVSGYDPDIGGYYGVSGQEGINYNIGSENGSTLSDIGFWGGGNITIDTDVSQITAAEKVNITINGDVGAGEYDSAVSAWDDASVTVNGDVNGSINAGSNASVVVDGNVTAGDDVYTDGTGSNGGTAVSVYENAYVEVSGDVTGGNASGNDYAFGGAAISAFGGTVVVGGNATGGNAESKSEEMYDTQGGVGITMSGSSVVSVEGDVTSGDSESKGTTIALPGANVMLYPDEPAGALSIGGTVSSGKGDEPIGDLYIQKDVYGMDVDPTTVEVEVPAISVGAVEDVAIYGFTEEEAAQIRADIDANVTVSQSPFEAFWDTVMWKLGKAKAGDELTVNAKHFTKITGTIIKTAVAKEVTLTIQWNGGEDIVITKDFAEDVRGLIPLADLAEMLKK